MTEKIPLKDLVKSRQPGLVAPDSVLIRHYSNTEFRACIVPEELVGTQRKGSWCNFKCTEQILPSYLVAIINSSKGRILRQDGFGVRMFGETFWSSLIPVPDLQRQAQCAGIYETTERLMSAQRRKHDLLLELVRSLAHATPEELAAYKAAHNKDQTNDQ